MLPRGLLQHQHGVRVIRLDAPEDRPHVQFASPKGDLEGLSAAGENAVLHVEQLDISVTDIGRILSDCGAAEAAVASFHDLCNQQFGENAVLNPENLINEKRFEIQAEGVKAVVDPDLSHLVEVQEVNGRTYIMLPADGTIDVNGVSI